MYPQVDESPLPASALSGRYVYDLVYNPPITRLLRDAAAAGCTTFGGLDMLVGAGAGAVLLVDRNQGAGRRDARRCRTKTDGVHRR